ncbi:unnamed protein product [Colias eurytheme]|nr:unnamed protein product [Colias eurytheme]
MREDNRLVILCAIHNRRVVYVGVEFGSSEWWRGGAVALGGGARLQRGRQCGGAARRGAGRAHGAPPRCCAPLSRDARPARPSRPCCRPPAPRSPIRALIYILLETDIHY